MVFVIPSQTEGKKLEKEDRHKALGIEADTRMIIKELKSLFSIKRAKKIFNTLEKKAGKTDVLGPEEIEKAFGIKLEQKNIPLIPFSKEELELANELGQFLILRVNVDDQDPPQPLTMKGLGDMMTRQGYSEITRRVIENHSSENWWTSDNIELRWALVSKDLIKGSSSGNIYKKTSLLKNEITEIFKDEEMPLKYQEAIKEFDDYIRNRFNDLTNDEITDVIGGLAREQYNKEFSKLKLNDLLRKTPAEELYDELAYFQINEERLTERVCNQTKRVGSDGNLVALGYFGDAVLVSGGGRIPKVVGIFLSRS